MSDNFKSVHGQSQVLDSIKKQAPKLWDAFQKAQDSGLIFIDEMNDSITATNRLLLTYPDLHEMISDIVDHWTVDRTDYFWSDLTQLFETAWSENGEDAF